MDKPDEGSGLESVACVGPNGDIYLEPAPHQRCIPLQVGYFAVLWSWSVVESNDIAIPLQQLKVGQEGSELYILSLARLV